MSKISDSKSQSKNKKSKILRITHKVAMAGLTAAYFTTKMSLRAVKGIGKFAWRHRSKIMKGGQIIVGAMDGAIRGVIGTCENLLANVIIKDEKLKNLKNRIEEQSNEYQELLKSKHFVQDLGIIGGTWLSMELLKSGGIPTELEEAYKLAYPLKAAEEPLHEVILSSNESELKGLIAGIKGKLFEMKYVDLLNSELLPDGYTATLAPHANQAGWDILIHGPNNELSQVFQLKATDSLEYVKEALERYPDIDVVTTDEVYSQLVLHAPTEDATDIINSGISDASLEKEVILGLDEKRAYFSSLKGKIPIISLALIAFTAYTEKDKSIYLRSRLFGERSAKAIIAYNFGSWLMSLTGLWWLALLGSLGIRWLSENGRVRRETYKRLKEIIKNNERIIKRLRKIEPPKSSALRSNPTLA